MDSMKENSIDIEWGIKKQIVRKSESTVNTVDCSPDGRHIAYGGYCLIRIYDPKQHKVICVFDEIPTDIWALKYSPDGQYMAAGGSDNQLHIWDLNTEKQLYSLEGHTEKITSVAFSPNGMHIATGSWDFTIRIWNWQQGRQLGNPLRGHTDWIISVQYNLSGQKIISGSVDNTIRIWSTQNQSTDQILRSRREVYSVQYFMIQLIISASADYIRFWDARRGKQIGKVLGHDDCIRTIGISPNNNYIVAGSRDCTLRLWNTKTRQQIGIMEKHVDVVNSAQFSCSGKYIISGSDDNKLIISPIRMLGIN